VDDEGEIAFAMGDVLRRPLRQESAIRARLAAQPQRAALLTFDKASDLAFEARLMRWGNRVTIGGERPLDIVLGQPMTEHGAAMIENDAIALAVGRPQATADHLTK